MLKPRLAFASLAVLFAAVTLHAQELETMPQVKALMFAAKDGRYHLAERKAKQAMEQLGDLAKYAKQVSERADGLRADMLDHHYVDLVTSKLSAPQLLAKSLRESLAKIQELEKGEVSHGLKAAKAGDYAAIDAAVARVQKAVAEYEPQVKDVEAKIAAVKAEYDKDFGAARSSLAKFKQLPVLQALSANKPRLIKEVKLEPAALRPLQWRIVVVKEKGDYNDPRFKEIPAAFSDDGPSYPVVVR